MRAAVVNSSYCCSTIDRAVEVSTEPLQHRTAAAEPIIPAEPARRGFRPHQTRESILERESIPRWSPEAWTGYPSRGGSPHSQHSKGITSRGAKYKYVHDRSCRGRDKVTARKVSPIFQRNRPAWLPKPRREGRVLGECPLLLWPSTDTNKRRCLTKHARDVILAHPRQIFQACPLSSGLDLRTVGNLCFFPSSPLFLAEPLWLLYHLPRVNKRA